MTETWKYHEGSEIQAPLSSWGDYVISHRSYHTVSYRPPGQHHHVGTFDTAEEAKRAACEHASNLWAVNNDRS